MKRFLVFVFKEFQHIFRDSRTLLILFGIPVAQILIFGFVIKNDIKDVNIGVYDQSADHLTHKIIRKLESSGHFRMKQQLQHTHEVERIFKEGSIDLIVVFEENFAEQMKTGQQPQVQLLANAADPNRANLIVSYASDIIKDFVGDELHIVKYPWQINQKTRMFFNPNLESVYMFVPGTMAMILMLISAMLTSISIAREKEMGSMENLLVSPLRPTQIIFGKVAPYVLLSIINAITILLLGVFVFGLPIRGSLALLMLESMLFITVSLSLGIFISTVSPNQMVALFFSVFALLLSTLLLSSFIFPIENMPQWAQAVNVINPFAYFMKVIRMIMLQGSGIADIRHEIYSLLLYAAVIIPLAAWRYKKVA